MFNHYNKQLRYKHGIKRAIKKCYYTYASICPHCGMQCAVDRQGLISILYICSICGCKWKVKKIYNVRGLI